MIRWRPFQASDEAALRLRHEQQCEAMGAEFPFPELGDPRYLMVEVAERDGEVAGAVIAHATVETMFLGADAGVARAAVREREHLRQRLLELGADEAHAFVPRRWVRKMERLLGRCGFRRSNEAYVAFYREL